MQHYVRLGLTLALVAGVAVGLPAPSAAAGDDDFAARLAEARDRAGADPQRARAALQLLRGLADAQGRVDRRLAVDEADCRVLTDLDLRRALAVADEGLARAAAPAAAGRQAWLRLRACRAGVLLQQGDVASGLAELELLLDAQPDGAHDSARALALVERGLFRSRQGELEAGQRDLLDACARLEQLPDARDRDLCLGHLANHYRRIGDVDEAQRLLLPLREGARRAGATFDDSIYTYALAQIKGQQKAWTESIEFYRLSARANEELHDPLGASYALSGSANALLRLGRPSEALDQIERALQLIDRDADPRQHDTEQLIRAESLLELGRTADAQSTLERIGADIRRRGERSAQVDWLDLRSRVLERLGRWQEAHAALVEARRLQELQNEQRLSQQSARLRMQFNRARDEQQLAALRRLNEQGQRLRQTQAVALVLFVLLLALVAMVAVRKFRQARHLQRLASTDELTGLANRRSLQAFVEDALADAGPAHTGPAVLMIDVDHFKRVNDSFGHAAGDEVLRHVAQVLAGTLRGRDRLGRWGGEEFLAVLPLASVADAAQVAERMRAAVEATPAPHGSGPITCTVSVGVADRLAGDTPETLAGRADAALYRAKIQGRNRVEMATAEPGAA